MFFCFNPSGTGSDQIMPSILLNSIFPIFSLIFLGYILKEKKVIDQAFSNSANQIIFNIAIPAMLLNEIGRVSFWDNFNLRAVGCALGAIAIIVFTSMAAVRMLSVRESRRGTFLQSTYHSNIGYMAYAIGFYALGESSFARMAILSSFLLVGQNIISVWVLTSYNPELRLNGQKGLILRNIIKNPIILSLAGAIVYSASGLKIPLPLQKGLDMLGGMALPTGLMLIGSTLSFGAMKSMLKEIVSIGMLKLFALPLVGYFLMLATQVPEPLVLPGVILLASPPATMSYVLAKELGGDAELAATSISVFTLASAVPYTAIIALLA